MSPLSGARERAVGVDLVSGSWNYSHACSGLRWGVACRLSPLSSARGRAVGVDLVFGSWNYSHACSGCCRATHRHSKTHWLRTLVVMEQTAVLQFAHLPCWPSHLCHRTDAPSPRPTGLRRTARVPSRGRSAHRQPPAARKTSYHERTLAARGWLSAAHWRDTPAHPSPQGV